MKISNGNISLTEDAMVVDAHGFKGEASRRKVSCLGPGGLTGRTSSFRSRDIHPSHYGRIGEVATTILVAILQMTLQLDFFLLQIGYNN